MKKCITCGLDKPYIDYYKHSKMSDGHLGRCKDCHKSAMRKNRKDNEDYYKNYDTWRFKNQPQVKERHKRYQGTELGIVAMSRAKKKFIENNPEKRAAHVLVGNAIRSGKLIKPDTCSNCGEYYPRRQIHGHHEDYTRPLDVVWLCVKCHSDHHNCVDT